MVSITSSSLERRSGRPDAAIGRSARSALRRRRIVAAALIAALPAVALGAVAPAQAKLQRVDVYTASLEMGVNVSAHSEEGGWSTVKTETTMSGTVFARVDGLVFVDGVPQQTSTPFARANTDDVRLVQIANYTSPLGTDKGHCRQAATEVAPLELGLVGTSIGANDEQGNRQVSIAVQSPAGVWIPKACTGYLAPEVADPLLLKPGFVHRYLPITEIGQDFTIPLEGTLACPDFVHVVGCEPRYGGQVEFKRTETYTRGEPDAPKPEPTLPPVPGDHATPAEIEAFALALMVRRAHDDKYGQAVVRCGRPCEGTVSAYAIALSKQGTPKGKATKLATTPFHSDARGQATPKMKLTTAQRRTARERGAIEFRAEATPVGGGETVRSSKTVRVGR